MQPKDQEKKIRKLRKRFIEIHGKKRWNSLTKYIDILWMTPVKISRVLLLSIDIVRYWSKKIRDIDKK